MLSNETFTAYLSTLTEDQSLGIQAVRNLIIEQFPSVVEAIDEGKWFGGLLTYNSPEGIFMYALGPKAGGLCTFHMMPYYALTALQQRHQEGLKKHLTGKSCIKFKHFADLPEGVIADIIGTTPKYLEVAGEMYPRKKKK